MIRQIRPARAYQHPQAPIRLLADRSIPGIARALRAPLRAAGRSLDPKAAEYLIANGRWREVLPLANWSHVEGAMRHPLALLGDVFLEGGKLGARKINGAFTSRRRVVRYKKAAGAEEERSAGDRAQRVKVALSKAILSESWLAANIIEKDQADLFNYDRFDPVTQTHIRDFQDALLAQLNADSRSAVEAVILRSMRLGESPSDIVADIRAVIGLTDRQAAAVMNFRRMLEEQDPAALGRQLLSAKDTSVLQEALNAGRALEKAQVDQLTQNYADNYLDYRALMIATTEATRAASLGLQDSYLQAVDRGVMPVEAVTQRWQISLDEKTCPHCLSVVDQNPDGVQLGEQFDSDMGGIDGPPFHPNCLPGDALVSAAGRVAAVSDRQYDGDVIVIRIAGFKDLTCTPNHPILTSAGFVAARLIKEGHDVVCCGLRDGVPSADVDNQDVPSMIHEIAEAFARTGQVTAAPMPVASEDFHGDGEGSDVAIIWTNRLLVKDRNSSATQHGSELCFAGHDPRLKHFNRLGARRQLLKACYVTASRIVGRLRKLSAGIGAHLRHAPVHALAPVWDGDAGFFQPQANATSRDASLRGQRINGFAGVELANEFINRDGLASPWPNVGALDAESSKIAAQNIGADPDLARYIFDQHAGAIQFKKVVGVGREPFSGHVYNLETTSGFYTANGIITHNCRCSIEMVTNLDLVPSDDGS